MKAIIINGFGGTDQLVYTELPVPVIKDNEVLVKVVALSVNPVDVKTRQGKGVAGRIKNEMPIILGWDISGVVTGVGKDVTAFKEGDAVFGMVNFPGHGKAYAEYVAVPADQLAKKPASVTHQQAAASTLAALTAWQVLAQQVKLKPGARVLVHAAAGGVGHFAVQLAKHLGAYVIGTSSAANKDFVLQLGADEHIDYRNQRFNLFDNEKLKVESLASVFHLAPSYVSEFFKKKTGQTLKEYILRSRVNVAKSRLENSDQSAKEIAYELGFTDASHMTKVIRKYYPSETGCSVDE